MLCYASSCFVYKAENVFPLSVFSTRKWDVNGQQLDFNFLNVYLSLLPGIPGAVSD